MSTMRGYVALTFALLVWTPSRAAAQSMERDGYVLPPESVQELFRRDKNVATLDRLSPDGDHFLVPQFQELTDLEQMSQRTLRLAMLEIVPAVNREWRLATYGNFGLNLYSLKERRTYPIKLPANIYVSDMRWSPDGTRLGFIAHLPTASQVWVADVKTGEARAVSEAPVMATLVARPGGGGEAADTQGGRLLQWLPDGSLLTVLVPPDRGPEPIEPAVPATPIIRRSRDKETPTSTQPFLLRTQNDERLFKHYTTAQLAIVSAGRPARAIGKPAMYLDYWLSPDGKHILRETIDEPLSYLVGFNAFGRRLEVVDLDGKVLAEIRKRPLQEAQTRGNDPAGDNLPREVAWRPDGKGLSLLWRERANGNGNGNDDTNAPPRKDRVMLLAPPFDLAQVQTVVSTEHRISEARYSKDGRYAFMTLARRPASGSGPTRRDLVAYELTTPQPAMYVLKGNYDPEDPLKLPGDVMTTATANGVVSAIVSTDGNAAFLKGDGYKATFTPQPFVDRVVIRSGATTRLFEGSAETFDQPLVALDQDVSRLVISRESKTTVPDSYLWTSASAQAEKLTQNKDPYPEITGAQRVDFDFTRRDGLKVQARISLPVGYQPGTRVPAVFWTYPREFEDDAAYQRGAIRSRNRNAYTALSFLRWSDIWLTQGYALVYPDIPILGKDGRFNDNYRPNLEDTIYSAIRKVDELGYVDVNRTEHGAYVSFNDGDSWQSMRLNMPDTQISDVAVKGDDLIVSTHGRSFWALQNITTLRQLAPETSTNALKVFEPRPAVRAYNRADVDYYLGSAADKVVVDILDSSGKAIRTFTGTAEDEKRREGAGGGAEGEGFGGGPPQLPPPVKAGLNRFTWDLRYPGATVFPGMIIWSGNPRNGPMAVPGKYQVRVTANGQTQTVPLLVEKHPLFENVSVADLQRQFDFAIEIRDRTSEANEAVVRIRDMKAQVAERLQKSKNNRLKEIGDLVTKRLSVVEEEVYQVRNRSGQDPLNYPIKINNRLAALRRSVETGDNPPTDGSREIYKTLSTDLQKQLDELAQIEKGDLVNFNKAATALKLGAVAAKPVSRPQ